MYPQSSPPPKQRAVGAKNAIAVEFFDVSIAIPYWDALEYAE
jgi:hypothetical protein